MTETAGRPRRRDAERNRARVLQAAREVFSRRGTEASLDLIAAQADLGVGTVHRAFGGRAALVEQIMVAELDDVAVFIDQCAAADSGWEALCAVMWGLTEKQLLNRGLHDMVFGSLDQAAGVVRERLEPALAAIVARAREEGRVRDDFTASDIAILTRTVASSRPDDSAQSVQAARRHVELLLKGIADTPDERRVPAPLPAEQPWQVTVLTPRKAARRVG